MNRHTSVETGMSTQKPGRIAYLDVLRGFALCGIIFVNIAPLLELETSASESMDTSYVLDLLVQQRFFPIFSLLFGVGFALTLASAASKHARPRVVLARRLGALAVLGVVHQVFQPGEALLPYAICGLVVLLPMSWAPTWVVLVLGTVMTAAAISAGGGVALIPGLILLGMAAVQFGVHRTLPPLRATASVLAVALGVAVPALMLQEGSRLEMDQNAGMWAALAGLALATAYCCVVLLLLRTNLSASITAVFAPLGRMALTNYIGATALIIGLGSGFGLHGTSNWGSAMILCVAILLVQWIFSTAWMRSFDQGPLEWAWRSVTWWKIMPLRTVPAPPLAV